MQVYRPYHPAMCQTGEDARWRMICEAEEGFPPCPWQGAWFARDERDSQTIRAYYRAHFWDAHFTAWRAVVFYATLPEEVL